MNVAVATNGIAGKDDSDSILIVLNVVWVYHHVSSSLLFFAFDFAFVVWVLSVSRKPLAGTHPSVLLPSSDAGVVSKVGAAKTG